MSMTADERNTCAKSIHGRAVAAGAGNLLPIPGTGVAADVVTMATMAMALSAVFGGSISENVAKNMAIATVKQTVLKQPIKTLTKEVSKVVPGLGPLVAPPISVAMLESAGWALAEQMAAEK